jgi:methionyl-tRNA synthetase
VIGADPLRYYLLREVVFGQDGNFSYDALVGRYNSDLANGLGNLASRTLTMIHQYRGGAIPESAGDSEIAAIAAQTIRTAQEAFDRFEFSKGLEAVWALISAVDKFIVQRAPWKLARTTDEVSQQQLGDTLYTAAEALRIATALLYPVMPQSTPKIWKQLGMTEAVDAVRLDSLQWGGLKAAQKIGEVVGVFPRIEAKDAIDKMRVLEEQVTAEQAALFGKKPEAPAAAQPDNRIAIDDFLKAELRVGQVITAQPVKGSTKLMHMTVDIGEPQPRTIVAGIAEAYGPADLINRKVVIVANLQPRKLKGIESNGMIVAASVGDGKPVLAGFHEDIPVGARLK